MDVICGGGGEEAAVGAEIVRGAGAGAGRGLVVVGVEYRRRRLTGRPIPGKADLASWWAGGRAVPGEEAWSAGETSAGADTAQILHTAGQARLTSVPSVVHNLSHDNITVQLHRQPRRLQSFDLVPVLVLCVHRHELEQHQIEERSDDR